MTGSGIAAPAAGTAPTPGAWGGLSHAARVWVLRTASIVAVLALWEIGGRIPVALTFPSFTATVSTENAPRR